MFVNSLAGLPITAVAAPGLWFAQRNVAANVQLDWQREFRAELAGSVGLMSAPRPDSLLDIHGHQP